MSLFLEEEITDIIPTHFIIDYENVNYAGLKGIEFLTSQDKITIFYSDRCPNIIKRDLDIIQNSGCKFDTCKLVKAGKNALDFYIAVRVGEEIAAASDDNVINIAIITEDHGFYGVLDYCRHRKRNVNILTAGTIENAIINVKGMDGRKRFVTDKMTYINLFELARKQQEEEREREKEKEYRSKEERDKERATKVLKAANLIGRVDTKKLSAIMEAEYKDGKGLYYAVIKEFGMTTGKQVYRAIKDVGTEEANNGRR